MIDMNGLKQINDRFGHRSGDAAIREFARRLSQYSRASDTVARFGGDEFGILLTPVSESEDVSLKANRLETQVEKPFQLDGSTVDLSGSIGAAVYPNDGDEIEVLMDKADQTMYARKREHKSKR